MNTSNVELDHPILMHPILDDPIRMKRIISNPVYDKLTISRAAQIRRHHPSMLAKRNEQSKLTRTKTNPTAMKSLNSDQTFLKPISRSKSPTPRAHYPPPFRLPDPGSSPSPRVLSPMAKRRSKSISSEKKTINDGTIRYVNTSNGFEIQRYSTKNWLTIDFISKEACQVEERTFRQWMEKKNQAERLSDSIYTSAYYRQRWYDLLQSYRQGHLTHEEWAKQNYQLYCLKNFYHSASVREQWHQDRLNEDERQRRAQDAFDRWKGTKDEEQIERQRSRLTTANSQHHTDTSSTNVPTPRRQSSARDEQTPHEVNRLSIISIPETDFQAISSYHLNRTKRPSSIASNVSPILDQQRWSLGAMLKRVVGLAEPLPSRTKSIPSSTSSSTDSGFESVKTD